MNQKVIEALKNPSEDRQVAVTLYDLYDEPVTLYVFNKQEARDLELDDRILWTLHRRFEWEDAHPTRAFTWRYFGVGGPAVRFSDTYPKE